MSLILKFKWSETKLRAIMTASWERAYFNFKLIEFRHRETEKSWSAERSDLTMIWKWTFWKFCHWWCLNMVISHRQWFQIKLYLRKNKNKLLKICVLLHLKTAQLYSDQKRYSSMTSAQWKIVMWRWESIIMRSSEFVLV